MGKSKRGVKEYTREQELIHENKQLKQELRHLRQQISAMDANRMKAINSICADYKEDSNEMGPSLEKLKKEWACRKCLKGFLEITLYSKLGITHYYRACSDCDHRTPGQRYDEKSVKGIMVKSQKS